MTVRRFTIARVAIVMGVLATFPFGSVAAQTAPADKPKPTPRSFVPPKTPWGEPDLQGLYSNKTITPLERPAQFAGQAELSDEEIADLETRASARSVDDGRAKGSESDVSNAYNEFWWDRGKKVTTKRSSLVIDPPDGRVPSSDGGRAAPCRRRV